MKVIERETIEIKITCTDREVPAVAEIVRAITSGERPALESRDVVSRTVRSLTDGDRDQGD